MTKTKNTLGMSRSSGRVAKPVNRIRTWSVHSFVGILAILGATSVVACGQFGDGNAGGPAGSSATGESSTSDGRPLTVEEYAQDCGGKSIYDFDTVYEMVDAAKETLERLRETDPPREVRAFHNASIKFVEELIEGSKRISGTRRPSEWMFADLDPQLTSGLFRASDELNAVLFDLDSEVRKTLQRHGCIE